MFEKLFLKICFYSLGERMEKHIYQLKIEIFRKYILVIFVCFLKTVLKINFVNIYNN